MSAVRWPDHPAGCECADCMTAYKEVHYFGGNMSEEYQIQETAWSIFKSVACAGNWTPEDKEAALLDYIENQQSNEAFRDFLDQRLANQGRS